MEGDDLDNLIADSLGGVQSALESERKVAPPQQPSEQGVRSAGDAVKALQQGPEELAEGSPPDEKFFCELVKTFQDEKFQKMMAAALEENENAGAVSSSSAEIAKPSSEPVAKKPETSSATSGSEENVEDFLQNFLKSFENAVGNDGNFEKSISSLMTSMLSNDLICEPMQQMADALEPWIKAQKNLPEADMARYKAQLSLYRRIIQIYKDCKDPLPEDARIEVQRLLTELHSLGQPPDEVMQQMAPKEADDSAESFEDFMKSMGLDSSLGAAEQDLLKKLAEDPQELTKAMKDMAEGLPDEGCKQQ